MKKASRLSAFMMAAALTLTSLPVTALANAGEGTLEGESDVKQAIINVVLPTNLTFALDPLQLTYESAELATEKNQLAKHNFYIINKSDTPILAAFGLYGEKADGVAMQAKKETLPTNIKPADVTAISKTMYFGVRVAQGLKASATITNATTAAQLADIHGGYPAADNTAPEGFNDLLAADAAANASITSSTAPHTKLAFILKEATYPATGSTPTALADSNKGIAAFQFYAEMNSYAPWVDNDIKISGAYTLTALSQATVAAASTDLYADAGVGTAGSMGGTAVKKLPATIDKYIPTTAFTMNPSGYDVKLMLGTTTNTTILRTKVTEGGGMKILFSDAVKPTSIAELKVNTQVYASGTDYTYSSTTGIITLNKISSQATCVIYVTTGVAPNQKVTTINTTIN